MEESTLEPLTKTRLTSLRGKWSKPDRDKGRTWEFDGVPYSPEHFMSYNHEMREGLSDYDCKTFDELVTILEKKLGRKPDVIDLMGGAYFLSEPGNVNTLVAIRVHDKDKEFIEVANEKDGKESRLIKKVTGASNRRVIDADVLTTKGWKDIEKAGLPKADLLVCRPVGPFDVKHAMDSRWDEPGAYVGLYASLFGRMLRLVNKKDGVIFTEVPDIYTEKEVKKFFVGVDEKEGSQTEELTAPDKDYHWGGRKRRYAVIEFTK